jgi:hypothetical protein
VAILEIAEKIMTSQDIVKVYETIA